MSFNFGSTVTNDFSTFSDDEKLNYALKLALNRVQTWGKTPWYQEPRVITSTLPNLTLKNKIPPKSEILEYYIVDPDLGKATDRKVKQAVDSPDYNNLTIANIYSYTHSSSIPIREQSEDQTVDITNGSDTKTLLKGISKTMIAKYVYWENQLTGKLTNSDGTTVTTATDGDKKGTYPDKTAPFSSFMTLSDGAGHTKAPDINDRRWSTIMEGKTYSTLFNRLEDLYTGLEIIHWNNIEADGTAPANKRHPFFRIFIGLPTYSTYSDVLRGQLDNIGVESSKSGDNIGFTNKLLEAAMGSINDYPFYISAWNKKTKTFIRKMEDTYGDPDNLNILYFLSYSGFILNYGEKNILDGKDSSIDDTSISIKYPPTISFVKYTGETFSDGIISQGDTLPAEEVSNVKDLFINTSDNTIHRLEDNNGTKRWVGIGGGGGSGGEDGFTKDGNNLFYTGGNVGIGKTDPKIMLDVFGDKIGRCTKNDEDNSVHGTKHRNSFKIGRFDGDNADNFCGLELNVDTADNLGITGFDNQSSIIFKTWGYGNGTDKECMRIRSDGNVIMGEKIVDTTLRSFTPFKFVQSISCGENHSAILLNSGKVVTFGKNNHGQLGNDSFNESPVPVAVQSTSTSTSQYNGTNAISVSCGHNHTAILLDNGKVLTFGSNYRGQLGELGRVAEDASSNTPVIVQDGAGYEGNNAVSVSCGAYHTVILLNTGKVVAFGSGYYGELGNNSHRNGGTKPDNIGPSNNYYTNVPQAVVIGTSDYNQTNAIAISCGEQHTAILLNTGKVVTFGDNFYGQLGSSTDGERENAYPWNVNTFDKVPNYTGKNAISVSCGYNHTAILLNNGKVFTFGYNDYGQLGNGNNTSTVDLKTVTSSAGYDGTNAIAVSCGSNHTAVLLEGGKVVTCGNDKTAGILGTGAGIDSSFNTLQEVVSSGSGGSYDKTNTVAVSCGNEHTLVLLDNGVVNSFGYNEFGQLGVGNDTNNYYTPTNVVTNASYNNNAALLRLKVPTLQVGTLEVKLIYYFKQSTVQFPILNAFVTKIHKLDRSTNYNIFTVDPGFFIGDDDSSVVGKLSVKSYKNSVEVDNHNPIFKVFTGHPDWDDYEFKNTAVSIAERSLHLANNVYRHDYGMVLGIGAHPTIGFRTKDNGNNPTGVIELAYRYSSTDNMDKIQNTRVVIDANGSSYFNGGNVGIGKTNPDYALDVIDNARISKKLDLNDIRLTPFKFVQSISCGDEHSAILLSFGKVMTFGNNERGQLGVDKSNIPNYSTTPVEVQSGGSYNQANAISVDCGHNHTAILLATGTVVTFGDNTKGQLGVGSSISDYTATPTNVNSSGQYNGTNAISVSCGGTSSESAYHTAILLNNGKVVTFGDNSYGQLGRNTTGNTNYLQDIVKAGGGYTGNNAIGISCGGRHTAILLNSGTVIAFGDNVYGQLGRTSGEANNPGAIDTILNANDEEYNGTNAVSVSCGIFHTAILIKSGKVYTFGRGEHGRLGNNNVTDNNNILQAVTHAADYDGTNAIAVSCGGLHTGVLLNTGEVLTCGYSLYGLLGVADTTGADFNQNKLNKVAVSGSYNENNTIQISFGDTHNLMLLNTGVVVGFGVNGKGELGVGNTSYQYTPRDVVISGDYNLYNKNAAVLELSKSSFSVGETNILSYNFKNSGLHFPKLNAFASDFFKDFGDATLEDIDDDDHSNTINTTGNIILSSRGNIQRQTNAETYYKKMERSIIRYADKNYYYTGTPVTDETHKITFGYTLNNLKQYEDTNKYYPTNNAIKFQMVNGASTTNNLETQMIITGDGNVGIGTANPEYKLDVDGDARIFKSLDLNVRSNIPFKFVQSISCGLRHSAILLNSGKVVTFGKNNFGQLGVAGLNESPVPVAVQSTSQYDQTNAISVSCGYEHTAILLENGKVLTFGYNGNGQLGNTASGFTNVPSVVQVGAGYEGNNAVSISCGQYHTAILLNTGKVVTFGSSQYGQLGNNMYNVGNFSTPQAVVISSTSDYDQTNAIAISCGAQHTAVLLNTGKVVTFGNNADGQLGAHALRGVEQFPRNVNTGADYNGRNAISVSCGYYHTAILLNTGKVVTFGRNSSGQLGNGNFTSTNNDNGYNANNVLQTVTSSAGYIDNNAIAISCGRNQTAVVLEGGKVVTCGGNEAGKLGIDKWHGSGNNQVSKENTLQEVVSSNSDGSYDKTNAVAVSCGYNHNLVLLDNGVVNSLGVNTDGQLGTYETKTCTVGGTPHYCDARTLTNIVRSEATYNNNAALLELNFNYLNVGPGGSGFSYSFKFNDNNIQFYRLDSFVESVYEKNYSNGYGIGFERIEKPLTINSYNGVGIGTNNPRKALEIVGGDLMLYSGENDGGENKLFFNHSSTSGQYQKVAIISEALGTDQKGRANLHFCVNTDDDDDNKTANATISDSRLKINGTTGDITVANTINVNGNIDCDGDIECNALTLGGNLHGSGSNITCHSITCSTSLTCTSISGLNSFSSTTITATNLTLYNKITTGHVKVTSSFFSDAELNAYGLILQGTNPSIQTTGGNSLKICNNLVLNGDSIETQNNTLKISNNDKHIVMTPTEGSASYISIGTTKQRAKVTIWGSKGYRLPARFYSRGAGVGPDPNYTETRALSLYVTDHLAAVEFQAHSDIRIKENIVEVPDDLSLRKLRDISCCYYNYIDRQSNGNEKVIGFIAQQVKKHFPMAVSHTGAIIPNEMRNLENVIWEKVDISGNEKYKLTIPDLNDLSGNINYRFYVSNDISDNELMREIPSLEDDPKSFIFDQSWNNVFLYGKEVNDFHIVCKSKLFALNFSATQEIDRIQQQQIIDISENKMDISYNKLSIMKNEIDIELLKIENTSLKSENQELKTEVETLKSQIANILTRLSQLESQ